MKVLLLGILGTYNYGCEAIVRGTESILKEACPGIQIDYMSPSRRDDDLKRLAGSTVRILKYGPVIKTRIFVEKVLRHLGIHTSLNPYPPLFLKRYNAVFSIGGDIYTIWDNGEYPRHLIAFGEYCERLNVPYILWGCSVGPFEKDQAIKKVFQDHLSRISLIVAREPATISYLKELGIDNNVEFMFDPAFSVKSDFINKKRTGRFIGVNLSPLSLKYLRMDEKECVAIHSRMIALLINKYHYKIVLLPHVVSCDVTDNDFVYLKKVFDAIPDAVKTEVKLIDNDPGFIGLKKYIADCDVVISARMHCAINAISCGIPAIFLSYSEKSKGMSKLVYGTERYCVPLPSFCTDNVDYFHDLIGELNSKHNCFILKPISEKLKGKLVDLLTNRKK